MLRYLLWWTVVNKGAADKIQNTDLKNPWLSLVGQFVEVRRASSLWICSRTDGRLLPLLFDVVRHYLASCFPCSAHISYQADLSHPCRDHKWLNCGHFCLHLMSRHLQPPILPLCRAILVFLLLLTMRECIS